MFPVIERHTWLNHAAISPWPAPVVTAMREFVEDNAQHGPLNYSAWMDTEQRLRRCARTLLAAEQESDIAVVKNTSDGLSLIASGLDWLPGDRMVHLSGEFPSNRLPWHQLIPAFVRIDEVPFNAEDPETPLIDTLDTSVKLVAVSSVRYDSGIRLDLDRIGRACRAVDALLAVDAIQHLGAVPLSVAELPVDFVIAGSHKWMLAPEGLALFWSRPEARARLRPVQTGWRMWSDMFDFDREDWSMPTDARRFEPGTLNTAGIHGLEASLQLLLSIPQEQRASDLEQRVSHLIEGLTQVPDLRLHTPEVSHRRAGIVTFQVPGRTPEFILDALRSADIFAAKRGAGVRLSPHFYTPVSQLDRTLDVLSDALSKAG